MKLRTRLSLAFLLMSVVPLTAVTLYSYNSSIGAFRRAVESEESGVAADIARRMDLVTRAVGDRVDRISAAAQAHDWSARDRQAAADRFRREARAVLGDAASFVSRLQFVPAEPPAPPPPPGPPGPPAKGDPPRPAQPQAAAPPASEAYIGQMVIDITPPQVSGNLPNAEAVVALKDLASKLPQEITQQGAQALGARLEAAAKMLDQKARDLQQREQARQDAWRRRMLEGQRVNVPVRSDGRMVGTVDAQLDLDSVLATVLANRRRDSGEIAFAIDGSNRLHTASPEATQKLEATGLLENVQSANEQAQTVSNGEWVLVTRRDPSGILFGIARPVGPGLADIRRAAVRNLGLGLLVILGAFVGIVPLASRMTKNISLLHTGVRQIAQGDLNARVPVRSKDEIGHLAEAFNQMAQDLAAHQRLVTEQERLRAELELCRQIQAEMLPKHALRLGFADVNGVSIPAREVGGDFFNYFLLPDGEVALLVGDVSGKGVGAALLMANVQATLRARLMIERDLAHLADVFDREIEETTPKSVYLTLFVGILDSSHRVLRYVNAGHNPQYVLRASGGLDRMPSTGLPIGMFAGHGYEERALEIAAGDVLFFYTDGMTETENQVGEMFGPERLETLLLRHHQEGVDPLLATIEGEIRKHRGAAEQFDDATMMVLRLADAQA
jgi:serine phosphatase RsbU (regulator of sigma subunit)